MTTKTAKKEPTKAALTKKLNRLILLEEAIRLYGYEGADALIDRITKIEKPKFSKDGEYWHVLQLGGLEARSAVQGMPLWKNWAQAARREIPLLRRQVG